MKNKTIQQNDKERQTVRAAADTAKSTLKPASVIPKLDVSQPGDPYEQEADMIAERVMKMPDSDFSDQTNVTSSPNKSQGTYQTSNWLQRFASQRQVQAKSQQRIPATNWFEEQLNLSKGQGKSLPESTKSFMGNRFGVDFGNVKIHTGAQSSALNSSINAKAFAHGSDIYFNQGQFNPNSNDGKRLLSHELTHVIQQNNSARNGISREPSSGGLENATLPEISVISATDKTDEELAQGILDTQFAILVGWDKALDIFDKVLTSSSDKETKPKFNNVLKSFLEDKLMGELIKLSKIPGAGDAFALLGKLEGEAKRASAASESATLRDFYVQHKTNIGTLQQSILVLKDDFVAHVRITRERMLAVSQGSGMAGSPESDAYGMLRMHLIETLKALDDRFKTSGPEQLFKSLSEEWISMATVKGGMGTKFPAVVIIRLKKDYSVINAEIQGAGGQKIAEQLLKFSPDGVDVFALKAPRRIVVYADNNWPSAILSLDVNNRNTNVGSFAEGNWFEIEKYVLSHGLPKTKNIKGD